MRTRKISILTILFAILIIVSLTAGCAGTTANSQSTAKSDSEAGVSQTRTVTDSLGNKVQIPATVNRVADAWGAHNEIIAALGGADKIVATTLTADVRPWLYLAEPSMKKANTSFSIDASEINFEELLKTQPDVLFMTANEQNAKKAKDVNIPVVQLKITDFKSLEDCMKLTGEVMGGDVEKNAEAYISYFDQKIKLIKDRVATTPQVKKPKVLHIASMSPLTIDGPDSITSEGIELAGGVNAADVKGNSVSVSMEQILQWNPDVIIIGRILSGNGLNNTAQISNTDVDQILNNPEWQKVKAVQNKQVYTNPDGAFSWDRYSAEEALQIQWLAKLLNPDLFKDIDMVKETQYFFKTFMNYDLTTDQANRMLAGEPPLQ